MKLKFLTAISILALAFSISNAQTYATVDGDAITADDIAMIIRNPQVKFDQLPKDQQNTVISQAIEKKLLAKEAIKSGVKKNQQYIDAMKKVEEDLSLEIWMQEKFATLQVSDQEISDFHKNNPEQFVVPKELNANHILVGSEDEAKALIKELDGAKDKKAKFSELAIAKSIDPGTGKKGGELGWFYQNQMVPEFGAAASSLKKDEYTKTPVKSQFGYHIIMLNDSKESRTVPLAEVKENVKQIILEEKFRNEISKVASELRKKAKIDIK
ncbi:MAG: peptidylprolyl isomerase [Arcobacter butzleri]|jgi:parvulin-like peptidyl-prolyl isomerase|nr:peptidylprolyl isomerase [Arcobacteraceae bacterium]MDY0365679.1 peptidylprolyl isomerase [Arcobacteraceae bacterium]NLO17966.1 peptidylprolyl isomerase [Aliarcobacter butzleri]